MAKLRDFTPDKKNANRGTAKGQKMIVRSIQEDGFGRSVLADKNGNLIAGNKTLDASAEVFGIDVEPIVVKTDGTRPVVVQRTDLDLDDPHGAARRLAYRDNLSSHFSFDLDPVQVMADIESGFDFEAIDVGLTDLGEMLGKAADELLNGNNAGADTEPQIDKAEELRQKWGVESGQMWQLGEHRIICGDCTDAAIVARVMRGERAAITFTSPPYNAGVSAQLSGNTSIGDNLYKDRYNDNQTDINYLDLLVKFTELAIKHSDYVFVNLQILAGNKKPFISYLSNFIDRFADIAIWDKGHAAPAVARRVMNSRFEFVIIFSIAANRAIGTRDFNGDVANVYNGQPQRHNDYSDSHAATFPIDLPEHFIKTFSNVSEIVYEPFSGSGTTIIACENLNRRCRATEIDAGYVAVALERWAVHTGKTPVLLSGVEHNKNDE